MSDRITFYRRVREELVQEQREVSAELEKIRTESKRLKSSEVALEERSHHVDTKLRGILGLIQDEEDSAK